MYNKVIMIGRLTSTPELHKTNNDKSVARATIAVNRRYKDQNGEREADFVNLVLWGKLAEGGVEPLARGRAGVGRIDVGDLVQGQDVDVQVGHVEADDDEPRAGGVEDPHLGGRDSAGHHGQVGDGGLVGVGEGLELMARHHQDVARGVGLDGGEGDADVIGPHEAARDLAVDDLGEDGRLDGGPSGGRRRHGGGLGRGVGHDLSLTSHRRSSLIGADGAQALVEEHRCAEEACLHMGELHRR